MWALQSITLLFVSTFIRETVDCTYNIYMDKREMSRLLGIKGELYYVRNGTINHNALNHVFTLPANYVDYFVWESFDVKIPYTYTHAIRTSSSDDKIIRSVSMNATSGFIPVEREIIATEIVCSGLQDAEIEVEFNFNLTVNSNGRNFTQIGFKRKKLCHRDSQKFSNDIDQQPVLISVDGFDSSQLKVFYVVLCFGCSLFTSLIVCFLAYFVSNKKDSRRDPLRDEQQIRLRTTVTQNNPFVSSTLGVQTGTSTSSNMSHNSNRKNMNYTQLDNRLLDLHDKITEISIHRRRIRLQKIELEGTFGRVFNGTYTKEDCSEEYVLVKTVMDFACPTQVQLLLKEGLSMYGLKHRNIMSVMGVSMEEHAEPFVIYLREGYSNLKKFLQKCKLSSEGIAHTLTTQEVVEMALQIIAGIQYMHKKKILHKDLASRNCLIDATLNIKIADNALSRDLFPNDYHCLGDNENRPVKWLAIESLMFKTFSTASDVRNITLEESRCGPEVWKYVTAKMKKKDFKDFSAEIAFLEREVFAYPNVDGEDVYLDIVGPRVRRRALFSSASNAHWSFGVTLWELTTLAQQPYVEVDPFEIEYYLKDGYRLSQPVNCPDELFAVMAYCWAMSPDERPTFSQLLTCLQDFRSQLNKFV